MNATQLHRLDGPTVSADAHSQVVKPAAESPSVVGACAAGVGSAWLLAIPTNQRQDVTANLADQGCCQSAKQT